MREWSKETKKYDIGDGFTLERAEDNREFAKYFSVYRNENVFLKYNWSDMLSSIEKEDICFWIKQNNLRIGGVLMEPNDICGLFLIPPFSDLSNVLQKLGKLLLVWSDRSKEINAWTVLSDQVDHYNRLGFKVKEKSRCMIRPTEVFNIDWDDRFIIKVPNKENAQEISELIYKAEVIDQYIHTGVDLEKSKKDVDYYFKHNGDISHLKEASTLIYDKETKELVGVCLVSNWANLPLIYDVAVSPSYRRKGLANKMLRRALSKLNGKEDLLRLFVRCGNEAENIYYNLGFLPGETFYVLSIPEVVEHKANNELKDLET